MERLPLNGPTTGTFPASEQEATMGLLAAYKELGVMDSSKTKILHVMDNISDIGYTRPGANYTPPITSSLTSDNSLAIKPWRLYYKTIGRVHIVLDNLENIRDEMSEANYKQIEAELRFIRAYAYSKLIEFYGDVPLVLHSLGLDDSQVARTPKSKVQEWIISELTEIAENLPVSQSAYGNARASKVAAYMLLSRIALYSKKYDIAAASAKKAIGYSKGQHELTPFDNSISFVNKNHEVGEPSCSNIFGYEGYATSKEWIFVHEFNQSIGYTHNQGYYQGSRLAKGCAYFGPTQNLVDSYQCKDGQYITESPLYNENNPYENRDPRLDLYVARPGARLMGFEFQSNNKYAKVANYWPIILQESNSANQVKNSDATNAYRSFSGYYWRKHTDLKDYATNSSRGVSEMNVGVFRYAELLLIYAEAKIELNEIDASVYDAINAIRKRAHMPELPSGLSQKEMRKALRYERKAELCDEGLRWYDLRRWGIAKDVMNGYIYLNRSGNSWTKSVLKGFDDSANPVYNHTEAQKYFNFQEVVFQVNKDELWPIPEQELNVNEKLTPNPGY